ncbi:P-loop containing nucleoside triphosphate hydrolase protein [Elaphomyces granulatus]|jgi:GTP-binding protein EngB required for normal cell division
MKKENIDVSAFTGMHGQEHIRILDTIDRMRDLGINEDLSIPQIVVVGDQSSGKSSTLQAITQLPLAVDSELCTRFATQIVLRRTAHSSVKVSIIPSSSTDDATKRHLQEFFRSFDLDEFDGDAFTEVVNEAAAHMGLPSAGTDKRDFLERRFSGDVLKIELSGPDQLHLSVVDVPGLFHNPTKFQTKSDLAVVRELISNYMQNPRSIILAVMDARVNISNQEVFRLARSVDKDGFRTVGVITKCDALQPGDEKEVLQVAQNSVERLKHGWFLVKNRSTQDILRGVSLKQRNLNEKTFFQNPPWNALPKQRMGIDALKDFLGQLLLSHIRKEYPQLVKEIESLAEKTEKDLEACGPPRQTPAEQRRYLTRVAMVYQKQVSDSLIGLYNGDLGSKHPLKLRLNIRTINEDFADDFKHNGHKRVFKAVDGGLDSDFSRYNTAAVKDEEDIYEWIREVYRDSRGVELPGTVNPAVLEHIFRQQSIPWQDLSERYLSRAKDAVKSYLDHIFPSIIGDEDISSKLVAFIQPKMTESTAKADEELKDVLQDERGGVLQTVNRYMSENIAAIREERVMARLKAATQLDKYNQPITFALVSRVVHLSNEDHTVYDIHDILKAYYKVAGKRFMDNVVMQVVERHILGDRGPLKLFTPDLVADLSDEDLEFIAGESYSTSATRAELKSKLERLRRALGVAAGIPR